MTNPRFAHGLPLDYTEEEFREYSMLIYQREQEAARKPLDVIADKVLRYKPKPKTAPAKKRARRAKKIQRESSI